MALEEKEKLAAALMPQLEAFVNFARKRVADPELAADVVQDSLLKAMRSGEGRECGRVVLSNFAQQHYGLVSQACHSDEDVGPARPRTAVHG